MRRVAFLVLSASALVACSFDFGSFSNGGGGAGGTAIATTGSGPGPSTGTGPATTTSGGSTTSSASGGAGGTGSSSSTGTTSTSTTGATSTSASTGAGGSTPLSPCGGVTDDFASFPNVVVWATHGTASTSGGKAKLQVVSNDFWAAAWHDTANIDDCYVSIDLADTPSSGAVFINIHQTSTNDVTIGFDESSSHELMLPGGQNKNLGGKPDSLGIAIAAGNVYYLTRSGSTWTVQGSAPRPMWMNLTESLGFGIGMSSSGKNATFDNWSMAPLTMMDLGL